jgi:hypothetical protein
MHWGVHAYPSRYDFVSLVNRIFDTEDLAALGSDGAPSETSPRPYSDQSTSYHQMFYRAFPKLLESAYRELVRDIAPAIIGTDRLCYQAVPTLRIHMLGHVAVSEFHRDKDYNHQVGEVNFWLPLTPAWDTNTVWVESVPGRGDYRPVNLSPGQVYVFDGVNLRHGNKPNTTGATRVSFDFRCLPLDQYVDHGLRSVNAGRRMAIGDYFAVL